MFLATEEVTPNTRVIMFHFQPFLPKHSLTLILVVTSMWSFPNSCYVLVHEVLGDFKHYFLIFWDYQFFFSFFCLEYTTNCFWNSTYDEAQVMVKYVDSSRTILILWFVSYSFNLITFFLLASHQNCILFHKYKEITFSHKIII